MNSKVLGESIVGWGLCHMRPLISLSIPKNGMVRYSVSPYAVQCKSKYTASPVKYRFLGN